MNIERKLVSVRKISDIVPHLNADTLDVVIVDGWRVIVKKQIHQVGDLILYFEPDSFLPTTIEFEFMPEKTHKEDMFGDGFLVSVMKLRGEVSQGLILPLSFLDYYNIDKSALNEGTDLTSFLGVRKYEPKRDFGLGTVIKGSFPRFLERTDEERIQNIGKFSQFRVGEWEVTEKIDGTSFTAYWTDEGKFGVCSRNLELKEDEKTAYWRVVEQLGMKGWTCLRGYALQGELIGPGIQGNKYHLTAPVVKFFTLYDIKTRQRLSYNDLRKALKTVLGDVYYHWMVPLIDENLVLPTKVQDIVDMAGGESLLSPSVNREGLVFRQKNTSGQITKSFKVVSTEFLLKEKKQKNKKQRKNKKNLEEIKIQEKIDKKVKYISVMGLVGVFLLMLVLPFLLK